MVDHAKCDIMNLLLAISNGLGLKSVGYCFQFLEFHTYNNNKIVFITVIYIYMKDHVAITHYYYLSIAINAVVHIMHGSEM